MAAESTLAPLRAYRRNRARLMAYGQWEPYTDAEPVRRHVVRLMDGYGLTYDGLRTVCGVSRDCLKELVEGDARRGRPMASRLLTHVAETLLAVEFDLSTLPGSPQIWSVGTQRRIQGLAAIGHPIKWQAAQVGKRMANYHALLGLRRVSVSTARMVRDLHVEWSSRTPAMTAGAKKSITAARRNRWLPPAAWDDEWLDLADEVLQSDLDAIVADWSFEEVRRCAQSRRSFGDRSPLTLAGAREYYRRSQRPEVEEAAHVG